MRFHRFVITCFYRSARHFKKTCFHCAARCHNNCKKRKPIWSVRINEIYLWYSQLSFAQKRRLDLAANFHVARAFYSYAEERHFLRNETLEKENWSPWRRCRCFSRINAFVKNKKKVTPLKAALGFAFESSRKISLRAWVLRVGQQEM